MSFTIICGNQADKRRASTRWLWQLDANLGTRRLATRRKLDHLGNELRNFPPINRKNRVSRAQDLNLARGSNKRRLPAGHKDASPRARLPANNKTGLPAIVVGFAM